MRNAGVVLLSGGLDSTTALAVAKRECKEVHAITFDYGQRHRIELKASSKVAKASGVKSHIVMKLDMREIGGSALTDPKIKVPKGRSVKSMGSGIPCTYVPARNTIFLSIALARAEVVGATAIYIGANQIDYSGYPDCREDFFDAFEKLAKKATKVGVEGKKIVIKAPLIYMTKAMIIQFGTALGVDYSLTHSCYDPVKGRPCGKCDSCKLRAKGFKEAGIKDPALA
jgi:7-cyano-7-deazaguanine synthase